MTTTEDTRAETFAMLTQAIADLEGCTTDDDIMAWPYGLAVAFTAEGKPYAASLEKAATADDVLYVVRNGANIAAKRVRRLDACREHAAELRRILTDLEARP